jgi:hypothetical protein
MVRQYTYGVGVGMARVGVRGVYASKGLVGVVVLLLVMLGTFLIIGWEYFWLWFGWTFMECVILGLASYTFAAIVYVVGVHSRPSD